ncbi:hypothetical protein WJX72_007288 [[Myrmecia] bisecta]|uniref:Rho-GAP domain-containing protein n=1 Tax=[Myrmecia] bisecta TaxID=41462 RepID=A0AAW1P3K9_9CHLO
MNVRRSSKPVFGRNLEELFLEHKGLPSVFWDTLKYLSRHAMTTEGLFRTKADGRKVLNMKRMFDAGQDPFRVLTAEDQHVVAGVLKLWLGCLPQPVIPADMYSILLKTQSIPDRMRRMLQMHAVLKQMPASTLQVLYPLMEFLHHHSINQRRKPDSPIAPPDLARIFAPLLLRPSGCNSISCESDLAAAVNVADMMIKDYRTIFTVKGAAAIQLRLDAQQQENRSTASPGAISFGSPDAQATAVQSPPAGVSGLQCFPPLEPIGSGYLGQSSGACAYAVAHPGVAQDSLIDTIVDQLLFDATSACGKSRFEDKAGDSTQLGEAFGWREAAAGLLQPVAQLARLL